MDDAEALRRELILEQTLESRRLHVVCVECHGVVTHGNPERVSHGLHPSCEAAYRRRMEEQAADDAQLDQDAHEADVYLGRVEPDPLDLFEVFLSEQRSRREESE